LLVWPNEIQRKRGYKLLAKRTNERKRDQSYLLSLSLSGRRKPEKDEVSAERR
jgi:hypothetical protein